MMFEYLMGYIIRKLQKGENMAKVKKAKDPINEMTESVNVKKVPKYVEKGTVAVKKGKKKK